ncbi:MAG TPA: DDE-type integrase/transposase/recombinase [Candidatus Nanoarchaeia archaeon]
MRAYKIVPLPEVKAADLSKDALRRLTWVDWYYSHGKNAERTCRHFSLPKSVFYRWLGRFSKYNLRTLEFNTKTRRPKHLREMATDPAILKMIYDIRYADLSKSKYEIREGIRVAHNVIQKVINRHLELKNLSRKLAKQKRKYSIARIRAARELKDKAPGSLIQIDTKHLYVLGVRLYLFVAIDCKSRLGFVEAYTTASSKVAADFLGKVINYFPFLIEAINTDNGSEYLLNFHKLITDLGLTHYFTTPNTPKMNARVERLIQTLIYEFLNLQEDLIPEIEAIRSKCREFNHKYNYLRYHQALGYQTPAEYVNTLLTEKGQTVLYV